MCVIVQCLTTRMTPELVERCEKKNQDGIGVAYFEEVAMQDGNPVRKVVFKKGLSTDEAKEFVEKAPLPYVVHFRKKTVGDVEPEFTHPFPISAGAELDLEGKVDRVLFHNGTWKEWKETLVNLAITNPDIYIPNGKWSDSRAAAKFIHHVGDGFLNFLDASRFLILDATDPERPFKKKGGWFVYSKHNLFGIGEEGDKDYERGIEFSNDYWQ